MINSTNLVFSKDSNVKNLVFTILTKEYPLKIIELTNIIRKRYGKQVTFQAVRKAILELVKEEILINEDNKFSINKEWIKNTKQSIDKLYLEINEEKTKPKSIDSIEQGKVSVFTFKSLNEMMKFWQEIVADWPKNFKKGDYNLNCYLAAHTWEGLLHPDREKDIMEKLSDLGIKSYLLITSNTPLDNYTIRFYKSLGLKTKIVKSSSFFDRNYYVGTYGDTIVQAKYPEELVKEMDNFFKNNKSIDKLNLKDLSDIVNKKIEIKLTVIKNLDMAKQINKSIIADID